MKTTLKRLLFPGGKQPRTIKSGLARGLTFLVDPTEKSQRLLGLDERELAGAVAEAIADAGTFIDIGASDGYYTVIAAKRNSSLQAVSCEPAAALEADYWENLRLNGLEASGRIQQRREFVGTSGVGLDELVADRPEPIVVKIDVEGGELDVLKSGPETIARRARFVIETHSLELEQGCQKLLEEAGYRCQIIKPAWWRSVLPERRQGHNRWLVAQ